MSIDRNLVEYIKNNVFPLYSQNEEGHNINHINYVINRSINFAKNQKDIDINIVYTVAAYHDIGHHIDAKNHEKISAQIFLDDDGISKFFNQEEIKIIKEAIEDHRASSKQMPRSIYGKIVSSADRNTSLDDIMKRAYTYRLKHSETQDIENIIKESQKHIKEKYGLNGYAKEKMFFNDKEYEQFLEETDRICQNDELFKERYLKANNLQGKI